MLSGDKALLEIANRDPLKLAAATWLCPGRA
jgi:hypothetical protein